MNLTLTRIILFVREVDLLKDFYTTIFKLEVAEEIKGEWVVLKTGACEIGLHKTGPQYANTGNNDPENNSNTKLVFEIDTDIFSFREKLHSDNVQIKEVKTWDNYNYWLCDGQDPEGNVFQLTQRKT